MSNEYDAIVIGTGIIGGAIGLELAKRGSRTLNVDKLPAAGYGSTSNTCAIIRFHYSTVEGIAMARRPRQGPGSQGTVGSPKNDCAIKSSRDRWVDDGT